MLNVSLASQGLESEDIDIIKKFLHSGQQAKDESVSIFESDFADNLSVSFAVMVSK
jgi:hypothetical protein